MKLSEFVFLYPIFMSLLWTIGALLHYYLNEREFKLTCNEKVLVSVLVPCFNEEDNVEEIIYRLSNLNYPNYEIIAIDDGSTDNTGRKLRQIAETNDQVRIVISKQNRGKANALHLGLLASKGEYLVCVDADAYLDKEAINYMIPYFLKENNGQKVGAVTGNPQVRNRNSLLGKIQTAEFTSIVGSIKRAQRVGKIAMTVSGVVVTFSRKALLDVGLWDKDMITEDIAVTWKLHKKNWEIVYEPRAICWMLVPEKFESLWKQRVRWSEGGVEVLFRHFKNTISNGRLTSILLIEQILGIIWAYTWVYLLFYTVFFIQDFQAFWFQSFFLEMICLFQFTVATLISSAHDKTLRKEMIWIIWYPLIYWYFNAFVISYAFIKTVLKKKQEFATWDSPDRGNKINERIDINENIAEEINLEENIVTTYKSRLIHLIEIIFTIILWAIFGYSFYNFISYIVFNVNYLNVNLISVLRDSIYGGYVYFYFNSLVICIFIIIFIYLISLIRKNENMAENFNETQEIQKFFKVTATELITMRNNKIQVINNIELERRKDEQ